MIRHADGSVTLTAEEYASVVDDLETLAALQECGVDNWEGYSDAMQRKEIAACAAETAHGPTEENP